VYRERYKQQNTRRVDAAVREERRQAREARRREADGLRRAAASEARKAARATEHAAMDRMLAACGLPEGVVEALELAHARRRLGFRVIVEAS
jgi:hypothetical protein